MAHIRKRSVLGTSTTTGTGALTLSTTAVAGFRSVQSQCAVNDTLHYRIWGVDASGNATGEWEDGLGTYSATDTLTRTTVFDGSAGAGTAVNFSSGTKWVAIVHMQHGTLSPSQINANQTDYNPSGGIDCDFWRLTADQPRRINSIAGGWDGRVLRLVNVGTNADGLIILNWGDTTGTAANRFEIPGDIVLAPGSAVELLYDGASSRWRAISMPLSDADQRSLLPYHYTDMLAATGAATSEAHHFFDISLISSGTQTQIAAEENHRGIVQFSSSTTANSGAYLRADVLSHLIQGGEFAEFKFRTPASITNTTWRFGFHDSTTSTDAVDGAYFELPGSFACVGKTANNSTRTTSSTIATLSASTWYRARVEVDRTAANVTFTLFDDSGNQLGQQTNSANIPTGAGRNCGVGLIMTNSGTTATALGEIDLIAVGTRKALI